MERNAFRTSDAPGFAEPAFHLARKRGRATDMAQVFGKDYRCRDWEEGVWFQPFQVPSRLEAKVHR